MSKNTISDRAINSASEATRRLNPHLFTPQEPKKRPAIFVQNGLKEKRIRQDSKPLMNKLETEFYNTMKAAHPGAMIRIQALRFRLGNGIWYKPDFVVQEARYIDGNAPLKEIKQTAYEVKGPHAFRGGFENLKVAASVWTDVRWVLVWKEQGQWKEQVVLP